MTKTSHSYFVVMLNFAPRYCDGVRVSPAGREAIVDPEETRRSVVAKIKSGEYQDITFIHHITMNDFPEDVTDELIEEAALECNVEDIDRLASAWDHARALRNEAAL